LPNVNIATFVVERVFSAVLAPVRQLSLCHVRIFVWAARLQTKSRQRGTAAKILRMFTPRRDKTIKGGGRRIILMADFQCVKVKVLVSEKH
jgi:hypothetical protein